MKKLHDVITAVDYSEPARAAFDRALAISRQHGAHLTVVHAVPTDRRFDWEALQRIALMASLRQAAETAGVPLTVSVQHGDPARVILLHARSRRPDLIVLGTNGRSGLDRFRMGSVAETVARNAKQPVLVVPPTSARTPETATPFNNILVAVDFSEGSKTAIDRALSMANGNSRVTLVHVVRGVPPASASRYMYYLMEPEYQRQVARDAWQKMADVIPADVKASRKVHARVVTGDPATEISRVAAEADADLILVGVTARGAFGRLFGSSTAARVIRTAGRPVLAIPQLEGKPTAAESKPVRLATAA